MAETIAVRLGGKKPKRTKPKQTKPKQTKPRPKPTPRSKSTPINAAKPFPVQAAREGRVTFGRFSVESRLILGIAIIIAIYLLANKFLNIIGVWLS